MKRRIIGFMSHPSFRKSWTKTKRIFASLKSTVIFYPPMKRLIIGFMSIICCFDISSYSLYIIITASKMPVPELKVPVISANPDKKPMVRPPIMVSGHIYLFKSLSKTLSSFLNPGICNPEDIIFFAWLLASIPAV